MPNYANTMPQYQVTDFLKKAGRAAARFVQKEEWLKGLRKIKEGIKQHLGDKASPSWIIMSVIGIFAALGFGIYAAYNAQGVLSGIMNPKAEDETLPEWLYLVVGASISAVGMLFGHMIYEGFSEGTSRNQYTGRRTYSGKLGLGIAGSIGAILYAGYQFYLVKAAAGDNPESLQYMPYVILGIAIIELLVGALILPKALTYMALFVITIMTGIAARQVNRSARRTNDYYRDYLTTIEAYNTQNPAVPMQSEGSDNIRRAIAFYSGIALPPTPDNNSTQTEDTPVDPVNTPANNADALPADVRQNNNNRVTLGVPAATHQELQNPAQAVETFLQDTIEDDLTV